MSPADADGAPVSVECQAFYGNMVVYVKGRKDDAAERVMDPLQFVESFSESGGSGKGSSAGFLYDKSDAVEHPNALVSVDFSTGAIPPFENDTVIKFFYNVDNPNTLSCPLQLWFHPSFEESAMGLNKSQLDGPHKDEKKHKKFPRGFRIDMGFETVE